MSRPDRPGAGSRAADRPLAITTLLAVALLWSLASLPAAARPLAQDRSPAAGHAQVIAQGVAAMPAVPVAWRVVTAPARPAAEAPVAERSLGFVLADEDPVVVTAEGTGEQVRLAAGEALFVAQGARQQRASTGGAPAGYFALELVVAPDVAADYSLGSAALVYASDAFAAPPGRRDLDLVRNVLAPGETSRLPATDAPTLLFVTAGTIRVRADDRTLTLRSGEAAALDGALDVTATGGAEAAFGAAVIGPAVGPGAATTAPPAQVGTGAIAVTPYACPAGMRPATFDPVACSPAPDVIDLQVFVLGSGANRRTLADARFEDGAYVWSGLPFGEYLLQATEFAPGYDRFLVPGLDGINSPPELGYTAGPNEGYLVPLEVAAPVYRLDVFAFQAASGGGSSDGTAVLGLWVWACPPGVVAAPDMTNAGCTIVDPLASGLGLSITGPALADPLSMADTVPADAGARAWEGVPYTATTP